MAQNEVITEGKKEPKKLEIYPGISKVQPVNVQFEILLLKPNGFPLDHTGFSLLYTEQHEQASWVAYKLTAEETRKTNERTNNFKVGPKWK